MSFTLILPYSLLTICHEKSGGIKIVKSYVP